MNPKTTMMPAAMNLPPIHTTTKTLSRTNSRHPQWSIDPLTQRLMDLPVTIRAPCRHTVDKTSFVAWTNQGNTVCPVCFTPMTQVAAFPNQELADRIQKHIRMNGEGNETALEDRISPSSLALEPLANHKKTDLASLSSEKQQADRLPVSEDQTNAAAQKHVRFRSVLETFNEEEEKETLPSPPSPSSPRKQHKVGSFLSKLLPAGASGSPPSTPPYHGKPRILETLKRNITGSPTQKIPVLKVTVG